MGFLSTIICRILEREEIEWSKGAKLFQIGVGKTLLDDRSLLPQTRRKVLRTVFAHQHTHESMILSCLVVQGNGGNWHWISSFSSYSLRSPGVVAQPWDILRWFRGFWRSSGALVMSQMSRWGSLGMDLRYHHVVKQLRRISQHQAQKWLLQQREADRVNCDNEPGIQKILARFKHLPLIKGSKLFSSHLAMDHSGRNPGDEIGLS